MKANTSSYKSTAEKAESIIIHGSTAKYNIVYERQFLEPGTVGSELKKVDGSGGREATEHELPVCCCCSEMLI